MHRLSTFIYVFFIALFFDYSAWMIGPYLRSVFIRDAVVTAWLGYSVAPIDGRIVGDLPDVRSVVKEDGGVVAIENDLLFNASRTVEPIRDQVVLSRTNVEESRKLL